MDAQDFIYGKNVVLELLKHSPKRLNKILISKTIHNDSKVQQIIDIALKENIIFQFLPKEKFFQYDGLKTQGIVALSSPIEYLDLSEFLNQTVEHKKYRRIVILDGIEDPHNFGSIARTCVCAGLDAIVISNHRTVKVNSTVQKASAGAINHIPIIKVNSISATVDVLKKYNWWTIATDICAKDNYFDIDYTDMNFAIIMGKEQSGVSKSALNKADFRIKINMKNDFNSLNVANATSIIIFEALRQQVIKNKKLS